MPKHALRNIGLIKKFLSGKRPSLFLDYDGTLTSNTAKPEDVDLSPSMKEILATLLKKYPAAVISGRKIRDLIAAANMEGFVYSGNHGLEIKSEDFSMLYDIGKEARKEFASIEASLAPLVNRFKEVELENKELTFTMHYWRLDSRSEEFFREGFFEAMTPFVERGAIRIARGKRSYEIRPNVRWDKGRAVGWILERKRFIGTTPIYMGDDETDKDGFRDVRGRGISVFVGGITDDADFYLIKLAEVKTFLRWLAEEDLP